MEPTFSERFAAVAATLSAVSQDRILLACAFIIGFLTVYVTILINPILFAIGFVPDAGVRSIFSYATGALQASEAENGPSDATAVSKIPLRIAAAMTQFMKLTDGRYFKVTKSIPLDIIDGIDFFTRYRLEEAGIYEVQNLATANPILLHVEAPFGIYQTIDWVGQAQLCTVVGLEKYLILSQFNIRTVFDLERAVLSLKSTSAVRRIIGGILLMPTKTLTDIESLGDAPKRFPNMAGANQSGLSAIEYSEWATSEAIKDASYRVRLPERAGPHFKSGYRVFPVKVPSDPTCIGQFEIVENSEKEILNIYEFKEERDASIKHMVRLIMDDLHVMRLRQIWESIGRILGTDAATLDDSEDTFLGA